MPSSDTDKQVLSDLTLGALSKTNVPNTAVSTRRKTKYVPAIPGGSGGMNDSTEKGRTRLKRRASGELTKGVRKTRKRARGDVVQDVPLQEYESVFEYNTEVATTTDVIQPPSTHEFFFAVHRTLTEPLASYDVRGERKRVIKTLYALLSRIDEWTLWDDIRPPESHPPCGHIPRRTRTLGSALNDMPFPLYNFLIAFANKLPESDITNLHNALAWRPGEPVSPLRWDPTDCSLTCEYHRPLDADFGRSPFEPPQKSMVIAYMDGSVPFWFRINPSPGQHHLTLTCVLRGLHRILKHEHVPRRLWNAMSIESKLRVAYTHLVRTPLLSEPGSEAFSVIEYSRRENDRDQLRASTAALDQLLDRLFAPNTNEPMRLFCSDLLLVPDSMFMGLQYLGPPYFWQLKMTSRHNSRDESLNDGASSSGTIELQSTDPSS